VDALSATVSGSVLGLSVSGDTDLGAGISMTYWVSSRPRLVFDADTASISFVADPNPTSGHDADVPWWFYLGGVIVAGITELVVTVIANGISNALGSRLGSVGLAAWAGASVHWPGVRGMAVDDAVLDGCLRVSGRPS
jgi:hypothetical protein